MRVSIPAGDLEKGDLLLMGSAGFFEIDAAPERLTGGFVRVGVTGRSLYYRDARDVLVVAIRDRVRDAE